MKEWKKQRKKNFNHYFFNFLKQLISSANTYGNCANDRKKNLGRWIIEYGEKYFEQVEKHLMRHDHSPFVGFMLVSFGLCNNFG